MGAETRISAIPIPHHTDRSCTVCYIYYVGKSRVGQEEEEEREDFSSGTSYSERFVGSAEE